MALQHLLRQGLTFQERNYRCRMGELDLIMLDAEHLVFVEVRSRKSPRYGSAAETVTATKQGRLRRAAQHYLLARKLDLPCRFDVVAIGGSDDNRTLNWIKAAFY